MKNTKKKDTSEFNINELEGWVIIWVRRHTSYPVMTSNISSKELAQELADGFLENKTAWLILRVCEAKDLIG